MSCLDCKSSILNNTSTIIGSPLCVSDCPPQVGCNDIIPSPCVTYTGSSLVCSGITQGSTLNSLYTAVELLCANQSAQINPITLIKKVSLTSSQILNLNTTPVEAIQNPGIGRFINIISVTGNFIYATTTYTTNTNLNLYYPGAPGALSISRIILSAGNTMIHFNVDGTVASNVPVMVTITDGNPLAGDSSLDIYITYTISNL